MNDIMYINNKKDIEVTNVVIISLKTYIREATLHWIHTPMNVYCCIYCSSFSVNKKHVNIIILYNNKF
jgi:hypothetical protein